MEEENRRMKKKGERRGKRKSMVARSQLWYLEMEEGVQREKKEKK